MRLKGFSDFLLESVINESVLYFSPPFREKLFRNHFLIFN